MNPPAPVIGEVITYEQLEAIMMSGSRPFPHSPNVPKDARFAGHPEADAKFLGWYASFGDQSEARAVCNELAAALLEEIWQREELEYRQGLLAGAEEDDDDELKALIAAPPSDPERWDWAKGEPLCTKNTSFDDIEMYALNWRLEARLGVGCLRWTHHRQYCKVAGLVTLER